MKKNRFTEEQIIGFLKQARCRPERHSLHPSVLPTPQRGNTSVRHAPQGDPPGACPNTAASA